MKLHPAVTAYIRAAPKPVQPILRKLRALVRAEAPGAEESMAYGMPAYKQGGKPLVYFAAFPKHIGLYATPAGHAAFKKELAGYKQGKGSVQFPLEDEIPYPLIRRIVAYKAGGSRPRP